jgi:hypothetical protein
LGLFVPGWFSVIVHVFNLLLTNEGELRKRPMFQHLGFAELSLASTNAELLMSITDIKAHLTSIGTGRKRSRTKDEWA